MGIGTAFSRAVGYAFAYMQCAWQNCHRHWLCCPLILTCFAVCLDAQEMQPRAYVPSPVGVNFFGVSYSNNRGGLLFDPSLPVEDLQVNANIVALSFGQSLGVFGRSAQALVVLPYVQANLDGLVAGDQTHLYRSGLGDLTARYAMNIYGAPAMTRKEMAGYLQKTIVAASLTMTVPIGQYDPARLVNISTHRWAFKPEIGISRDVGKWSFEVAGGVWLFTANSRYNGSAVRTQDPLGSIQASVVRSLTRRFWVAGDGTFFTGGRSQINGRDNFDYMGNARFGVTGAFALNSRQAIKLTYFKGTVTRVGSDIGSIGVSYTRILRNGR
jgi:hypothetical protein